MMTKGPREEAKLEQDESEGVEEEMVDILAVPCMGALAISMHPDRALPGQLSIARRYF